VSRARTFLVLASCAVFARLPFLLVGDRFFDSDEAVEGLMARHVLTGEWPLYMWGQHYKGVPEVYVMAAVFAVVGSSVVALKATTLAFFVAFVCTLFVTVETMVSRRTAWIAALLLLAVPPAAVQWSLSGNAELVIVMLAGSLVLLGWHHWRTSRSVRWLGVAAGATGFGLWVQQFIIYYLVAIVVVEALGAPRGTWRAFAIRGSTGRRAYVVVLFLWAVALLYLMLGVVAFFQGFAFSAAGIPISVTHAQKLWRIAAAAFLIGTFLHWIARGALSTQEGRRTWLSAAAAFVVGYLPAVVHLVATRRSGGPMAAMDAHRFIESLTTIAGTIVPILAGYRSGTTAWLDVPLWTVLVQLAALVVSLAWMGRARDITVFHVFLVSTPLVFLASGAFVDAQSYRYLIPLFGAAPVVFALGCDWMCQRSTTRGAILTVAVAAVFLWQQVAWYRSLQPDRDAALLQQCLQDEDVRYAYADYWLSYKLTFLNREHRIVAQVPRVDQPIRYQPYRDVVSAHAPAPTLVSPSPQGPEPGCRDVIRWP